MVPRIDGRSRHSTVLTQPFPSCKTPTLVSKCLNPTSFWIIYSRRMEMVKFPGHYGEVLGYPYRRGWDCCGEVVVVGRAGIRYRQRSPFGCGRTRGRPLESWHANDSANWNWHTRKCPVLGVVPIAKSCWKRRGGFKCRIWKIQILVSNCGSRKLLSSIYKRGTVWRIVPSSTCNKRYCSRL